jgi:chromosome segregation ATPase
MPLPIIPIAIAATVSGVVVGTIIYFFTSNNASERRAEYIGKVNEVLELLKEKASKLKEINELLKKNISTLEKDKEANKKLISQLKLELEKNKASLKDAQIEKENLRKEYEDWKEIHEKMVSGLTPAMTMGAINLIKSSSVFKENKYKPKKVIEFIEYKRTAISDELSNLLNYSYTN